MADAPENLVVVKAPADSIIRKVLVSEGAKVGQDAGIIENETNSETIDTLPQKDLNRQSEATAQNAQKDVDAAQREVERTSVEMQRMESLVASNSAPQAQLDAAFRNRLASRKRVGSAEGFVHRIRRGFAEF